MSFSQMLSVVRPVPSRRAFLTLTALAAAATGAPLLAGCRGGAGPRNDGGGAWAAASGGTPTAASPAPTGFQELEAHIMGQRVTAQISPLVRLDETAMALVLELTRAADDTAVSDVRASASDHQDAIYAGTYLGGMPATKGANHVRLIDSTGTGRVWTAGSATGGALKLAPGDTVTSAVIFKPVDVDEITVLIPQTGFVRVRVIDRDAAADAEVSTEALGGAVMHTTTSGVTDYAAEDEDDAIRYIKELLSYLPQNNLENPPDTPCDDPINRPAPELNDIIPDNPNAAYDIKKVITATVDNGIFFEIKKNFAPNIVIGFARYNGKSVGIVANQPAYYAGVLDINSSDKGARFVRFCDCFNIPVITFVDVPGFLPGSAQEFGGVIRHGAKLLYAYAESTIPKVTVITRKAYGGAYCVMSSKHLRTDINYSWPTGEIAVMGSKGAVEVLYAKGAKEAGDAQAFLAEKEAEYNTNFSNPYCAAERGYIDAVIEPAETRARIINALESIRGKRDTLPMKKHGNIPL